jgi:hypothetical protein
MLCQHSTRSGPERVVDSPLAAERYDVRPTSGEIETAGRALLFDTESRCSSWRNWRQPLIENGSEPIGVLVSFDLSSQQTVQQGTAADEPRSEEREDVGTPVRRGSRLSAGMVGRTIWSRKIE